MKILFDQNVPRPLARHLILHEVKRTVEIGWEQLQNGDLLRAAEDAGFELLVTGDKNLQYQNKLEGHKIGVLSLSTNNWFVVKDHLTAVDLAVNKAKPGIFSTVFC